MNSLDVYLRNRHQDQEQNWRVEITGIFSISAFSRFTVARDFVDVYDLIEIFDEERDLWKARVEEMRVVDQFGNSVHKLLFASEVFDGGEQGGIVVICRNYKVSKE